MTWRERALETINCTEMWQDACPWCGELQDFNIDLSAGSQIWVEDCQVCCRPIQISLHINRENRSWYVDVQGENQ